MIHALWIFGIIAVLLWVITGGMILFPPGDNPDAKALGEMIAAVPGIFAVISTVVWIALAAIHWI